MNSESELATKIGLMLLEDRPKCGHKSIELVRMRDQHGYYWHCDECSSNRMIEILYGKSEKEET